MNQAGLESFGAYRKALELFDFVVADMAELRKESRCYRLIAQQVASADSICANIEEGYGRLSRAEYIRFLDFARGSARETLGRYNRMHHWLSPDVIRDRTALAGQIVGILSGTIETLRNNCARSRVYHA
jgi:four helix bundle protein